MKKIATYLLPCLMLLACQSPVKADNGLALAYLFGYGGYGGMRMQAYTPAPPYFALHPPVYYGERYARPYGASPFAAWPQLQPNAAYSPQRQAAHAQMIGNPYYGAEITHSSGQIITQAAPAAQPVEIDNPYYQPEARYTSVE